MTAQYEVHDVDEHWYTIRETDLEVAQAIYAIAGGERTPEAIWEAPTGTEWDQVVIALENISGPGKYRWVGETIVINP